MATSFPVSAMQATEFSAQNKMNSNTIPKSLWDGIFVFKIQLKNATFYGIVLYYIQKETPMKTQTLPNETKKDKSILTNPLLLTLLATLCCALWGSATPFIKLGYAMILPEKNVSSTLLFAGIRFFLAGVLTIIIYSIAQRKFLYPKKKNLLKVANLSLFQTILQYTFFYIGLANTTGVKGTIISGSTTFFAILFASLVLRQEKLTFQKMFACILGFAGIVIINLNGLKLSFNFFGDAFVLFSTMASAASAALAKKYSSDEEPVVLSGYQFALGGLVLMAIGFSLGGRISVTSLSALAVLLYLAVLSAVAYSVWSVLLKYNHVSKVTAHSFLIPVFGVLLTSLLLSESSGVHTANIIISLVLVCLGIAINK